MARGVAGSKLPGKYMRDVGFACPEAAWYTSEPPVHEPLGFRLQSASILEVTPANEGTRPPVDYAQASRSD